jgi:hypothetical protein
MCLGSDKMCLDFSWHILIGHLGRHEKRNAVVLVYCLHLRAAAELSSGWVPHYQQRQWVSDTEDFACEITNLFIGPLILELFLMTTWATHTWRNKTDKLVGSHNKNISTSNIKRFLKMVFITKSLWSTHTHTNAITQKLLAANVKWG